MNGMGLVHCSGISLTVFLDKREWFLRIQFRDQRGFNNVAKYHNRIITPFDVQHLLPKWESLQWQPCRGIGKSRAVSANDGGIYVHLIVPDSSSLSDEQIIAELMQFMGNHKE